MIANASDLAHRGLFTIPNFFPHDECARLRDEADIAFKEPAQVIKNTVSMIAKRERRSDLASVSAGSRSAVEASLTALLPDIQRHFVVKLAGCQTPQFLVYRKGDYFRAHRDNCSTAIPSVAERKIAVVVFLSSASRRPVEGGYCGGHLVFYRLTDDPTPETCRIRLVAEAGLLVAFPADLVHEVMQVTHGTRYTIVSWYT